MSQFQDREMRAVLAALEIISAIPAKSFDAGHGTDDDPGGRRPPGDYGYRTFMDWYNDCRDDKERQACIEAARRELQHLRKGQRLAGELESVDTTRRKMLEETAGWPVQDVVCSRWRINATLLRRLRIADSRDSETGLPVIHDSNGQDLASRAREMKANGMTLRATALALGVKHPEQVKRLLKLAA